ncbi:MAG: hypothetical protein ABI301_01665 [Jatrophihabitantaceae bacterium]
MTVFSALAACPPIGVQALVNEYSWIRSRPAPFVLPGQVDLIGAAPVDSGPVDRAEHLAALASMVNRLGVGRYLAHPREDDGTLRELADRTGTTIVRPDRPVELALRDGPVAERVLTLGSTPALTLSIVLRGTGVRIEQAGIDTRRLAAGRSARTAEGVAAAQGAGPD